MDAKEIKDLLRFVRKAGFQEFEVRMDSFRLRVVKDLPQVGATFTPVAHPGVVAPAPALASPSIPPVQAGSGDTGQEARSGLAEIVAPMVGTFYRAPSPEADPFVQVGDRVAVGQTLCIIEAMKLMNEIEAEAAGEIVEIVPGNAQPVEYGETIFRIRPDRSA